MHVGASRSRGSDIDVFLEAFLRVTKEYEFRAWKTVIVGAGTEDYERYLHRIVASYGGTSRVTFAGWLNGAAKMEVIMGAALLALPSALENFGLVVAEALACAVPVVISKEVVLSADVINADAGWVCDQSPDGLATALRESMRDGGERVRRGLAGRAPALNSFTWERTAARFAEQYQSVTQRR